MFPWTNALKHIILFYYMIMNNSCINEVKTHAHAQANTHTHKYMSVCLFVCVYVSIGVCMYVCVCLLNAMAKENLISILFRFLVS